MPLNKYAPQVATHRRTQSAILEATKGLIATTGLKKMSMIEIADASQVSAQLCITITAIKKVFYLPCANLKWNA